MMITPDDIRRQEEAERIEKEKSLERRKKREAAQTQHVRVTLVRRGKIFGLGMGEMDGHCIVQRLGIGPVRCSECTNAENCTCLNRATGLPAK